MYYFWKRNRLLSLLVAYLFAVSIAYFGTLVSPTWHGYGAWGPRYLVPVMPLIVLALGFFLARFGSILYGRVLFAVLAGLGFLVNLLGTLVWYQLGYMYTDVHLSDIGVPPESMLGYLEWDVQHIPVVMHMYALAVTDWGSPPDIGYWPACIPDMFVYCSFGWIGIVPFFAAIAFLSLAAIKGMRR